MKVAFLLLCHEKPAQLARLLGSRYFQTPDAKLYVHHDLAAGPDSAASLRGVLADGVQAIFVEPRLHCRWGEFSLVEATTRLIDAALHDATFRPDYLFLISGSCLPTRPFSSLQEFLRRRRGLEFIQARDVDTRPWIIDGLGRERYGWYFPFNFMTQRRLFEWSVTAQKRLKVWRTRPEGLNIHFGSQWFCITAEAGQAVLDRMADRRVARFFRHSWIPDEFAIHSVVATEIGPARIADHSLTYYEFNAAGRPLAFHNDGLGHLLRQPFFFARKVSHHAAHLAAALEAQIARPDPDLSYFEDVGTPTPDVQMYLARAAHDPATRAWIGTTVDPWRGLIDLNDRPYLVLTGRDRDWLLQLTRTLREGLGVPCYDFVFDPDRFVPAEGRLLYGGFGPDDMGRRDHDPASFLVQLVRSFPKPVVFALDPVFKTQARDLVQWDRNAIVLICDPPRVTDEQRTRFWLRRPVARESREFLATTFTARTKQHWLPDDHFRDALQSGECKARILDAADELPPDIPYREELARVLTSRLWAEALT